jgi:HEAT repeat protein
MRWARTTFLILIGCMAFAPSRVAAAPEAVAADEQTLREAKVGSDGPALLEFLRQRTLASAQRDQILTLIRQLGDEDFPQREKASAALVRLGAAAVPLLRQALDDPDAEVSRRAERCLQRIETIAGPAVSAAVIRLVVVRKPARAAEALLAYLPFADDEGVAEEARNALTALAMPDGKPEPALIKALGDPLPLRRATAAQALVRVGEAGLVRRLLQDPDATVRLRVALLFAERKEADAFPVLIQLLADQIPFDEATQAEVVLRNLAGDRTPQTVLGRDPTSRHLCRDAWDAWWRAHDGPALLNAFRKNTPAAAEIDRIHTLIRDLGSDAPPDRQKASDNLLKTGLPAVPLLREALKTADAETGKRIQACIQQIGKNPTKSGLGTDARLVVLRKPAGAAGVLIAYLPFAEDEGVAEEVRTALAAVTMRDGKADPAVIQALDDPLTARRTAAAEALCRAGAAEQRPAVRKLLKDRDPTVRLQVALALAEVKDKESIPVLISLIGELPADQMAPAEDVLLRLAGEQAPALAPGTDDASRRKNRDAWSAWWQQNGARVDLARLEGVQRLLGYTLIAQWDNGQVGRILELGPDGKTRWEVQNIPWPLDFELLPGNRLLCAEYYDNRVAERNFKGELLWEKRVNQAPLIAQRLPNGNTFIATQNQILEVDRNGKELFTYNPPGGILTVRRLRNGRIAMINNNQRYVETDATGKELRGFAVNNVQNYCAMDVLPNGRVLVPLQPLNKIVEFNAEGKVVWEATVQQPTAVSRLPNGNTLVASRDTQQVYELDAKGKVVWERKITTGFPWRIRRR